MRSFSANVVKEAWKTRFLESNAFQLAIFGIRRDQLAQKTWTQLGDKNNCCFQMLSLNKEMKNKI